MKINTCRKPWKSRDLWQSMRICENQWKSVQINARSMKIWEKQKTSIENWKIIKTNAKPWKSMGCSCLEERNSIRRPHGASGKWDGLGSHHSHPLPVPCNPANIHPGIQACLPRQRELQNFIYRGSNPLPQDATRRHRMPQAAGHSDAWTFENLRKS